METEKKRKALSYFLASTWQNWMKRIGGGRVGRRLFWRGKRPQIPQSLCPLSLPAAGMECDAGHTWDFLTVFWPPHSPPFLSHGALISTDQAFNLLKMRTVCFHMHIGLNAKKRKKLK